MYILEKQSKAFLAESDAADEKKRRNEMCICSTRSLECFEQSA